MLKAIDVTTRQAGFPPTVREVQRWAGFSASSSAAYWLQALKDRGYVEWRPRINRTLLITPKGRTALASYLGDGGEVMVSPLPFRRYKSKATGLVALRDLLLSTPRWYTAAELAETFGVSHRTMQRWLLNVEELGVPLEVETEYGAPGNRIRYRRMPR